MTINTLLNKIVSVILQPLVALMFVVALVVFIWGIVQFIAKSDSEDGRETGKRNMVWGIVGMLIMFSVYGILKLVLNTFGLSGPPGSGI